MKYLLPVPSVFHCRMNSSQSRFARDYHPGTCVQLCMSFIDQPNQIPEPYDLFFLNRGRLLPVN
jgi:hypothetical protein